MPTSSTPRVFKVRTFRLLLNSVAEVPRRFEPVDLDRLQVMAILEYARSFAT